MSWDPPNPNQPPYIPPPPASPPDADLTVRRPVLFDNQEPAPPPAPPSRRWVPAVVIVVALLAGGGVAYLLTSGGDEASTDTTLTADTSGTTGAATTDAPGTTGSGDTTTSVGDTTTTAAPTTTTAPSPVTRDHLVFHDGYLLGRVTPTGFAAAAGQNAELTAAGFEVTSISDFQVAQFLVEVRSLLPDEAAEFCGPTIGPRPANNATPLGLWVEAPTWPLAPPSVTPAPFAESAVAVVAAAMATIDVPSPPFTPGQAVLADLTGDGVNDLVVTASYWDTSTFYRVVAVAMDADPAQTVPLLVVGGSPSADGAGNPLPLSLVLLRLDAIADLTGDGVAELVVRFGGTGLRGAVVLDLDGTTLGAWRCEG